MLGENIIWGEITRKATTDGEDKDKKEAKEIVIIGYEERKKVNLTSAIYLNLVIYVTLVHTINITLNSD